MVFSSNVSELVKSGRPLKQALAIAYSKKRAYGKGKKKKMNSMQAGTGSLNARRALTAPVKALGKRGVMSERDIMMLRGRGPLSDRDVLMLKRRSDAMLGKRRKMNSMDLPSTRGMAPISYAEQPSQGPMGRTMMKKKGMKKAYGKKMKKGEKNSLYKNIREKAMQNRKSGKTPKKPTRLMLAQEKKIKMEAMGKKAKSKPKMVLKKKMGKACKVCSKKMTRGACPSCK